MRRPSGGGQVGGGLAAGVARHADRQPAGRVDRAGEHLGERLPAGWPGKNACTTAAASSASGPSAYGRPVSSTRTTGVPVASTRPDQVGLDAGQAQVGGVAALARGAPAEQAGPVADRDHAHVGVAAPRRPPRRSPCGRGR